MVPFLIKVFWVVFLGRPEQFFGPVHDFLDDFLTVFGQNRLVQSRFLLGLWKVLIGGDLQLFCLPFRRFTPSKMDVCVVNWKVRRLFLKSWHCFCDLFYRVIVLLWWHWQQVLWWLDCISCKCTAMYSQFKNSTYTSKNFRVMWSKSFYNAELSIC